MEMTGEHRIPAVKAQVWAALNDPEILRQCIPGCEEIAKLSDHEMTAKVVAKVGPVKARFSGKVTLSDIDPPNSYTIQGEGNGGVAGFGKGGATVTLAEDGSATVLTFAAHAQVGGKLAQIGSRLVDATARKMAEDFFVRFTEIVGGETDDVAELETLADSGEAGGPDALPVTPTGPADAAPAAAVPDTAGRGLAPVVWVGGVIILVAALLWLFQ
ncbi:MAG: carbon monoxide dehydrogenase subunit G [Azospirillaceae bacterium]|nr:carbon monoxide dehydrogenase subunit G [Azospirillaceae bacterium]